MNFSPFPDLHSKRLRLRALKHADAAALSALRSDEQVNRYIDRPKSCDLAEAEAFILKIQKNISENLSVYWVITTAESDELIGTICLWNFAGNNSRADIGYELVPAWQGKGLMQEALNLVVIFAFTVLDLGLILAFTETGNSRSAALLQRHHFLPDEQHRMAGPEESAGYDVFFLRNPRLK